MEIQGLQALYAGHKSVKALVKALQDGSARTIFAEGLCASAAPLLFSSVAAACPQVMACPYVFVLDDAEGPEVRNVVRPERLSGRLEQGR